MPVEVIDHKCAAFSCKVGQRMDKLRVSNVVLDSQDCLNLVVTSDDFDDECDSASPTT